MHRAGQRALILSVAAPLLGGWHAGAFFDKAPGSGGGGGLFYAGSPREHGWDCTACHLEPPGEIRVEVTTDPPELLEGHYVPGTVYTFHVVLHEVFGLRSTRSNHNGVVITVVQPDLRPAGELGGFDPEGWYARGDNILATSGFQAGLTEWTFTWEAPAEALPRIGFYLGLVDGNGARTRPDANLTDPLGDDVFMKKWTAEPR